MSSLLSTYLKRAVTVALIVGPMLALVSADVGARGRGGGGFGGVRAPRANIGGGGYHANVNRNMNRDMNRNVNRNVNINRNVNVDVDRRWGYGGVGVGAAVAVGTAVAVGAIVSTLPPNCTTIVANGVSYRNCGGTFYVPSYDGPNVVYEVVNPPSGWNH